MTKSFAAATSSKAATIAAATSPSSKAAAPPAALQPLSLSSLPTLPQPSKAAKEATLAATATSLAAKEATILPQPATLAAEATIVPASTSEATILNPNSLSTHKKEIINMGLNDKKECKKEDIDNEEENDLCSKFEYNDCNEQQKKECTIHCCLRKILTKKRRTLQEQKKDLQNKKNNSLKINNNVTIKELDNKLSQTYKDNPTQRVSLIKEFIEKRKLCDNDVLFYKGLTVTEAELKDCNTNTKCKLTPKLAQEYLSKKLKRKKISNTSRTPILPTTLLNEIKKKQKKINN